MKRINLQGLSIGEETIIGGVNHIVIDKTIDIIDGIKILNVTFKNDRETKYYRQLNHVNRL